MKQLLPVLFSGHFDRFQLTSHTYYAFYLQDMYISQADAELWWSAHAQDALQLCITVKTLSSTVTGAGSAHHALVTHTRSLSTVARGGRLEHIGHGLSGGASNACNMFASGLMAARSRGRQIFARAPPKVFQSLQITPL